jgi:hypothetical protein
MEDVCSVIGNWMKELHKIIARYPSSSSIIDPNQLESNTPEAPIVPESGALMTTTPTPSAFDTEITPNFFFYTCI